MDAGRRTPTACSNHYQFQVLRFISCSIPRKTISYLGFAAAIGLIQKDHDVFALLRTTGESPTLALAGSWLGRSGSTAWRSLSSRYLQQVGGIEVDPVPVLRLPMVLSVLRAQGADSVYDPVWLPAATARH